MSLFTRKRPAPPPEPPPPPPELHPVQRALLNLITEMETDPELSRGANSLLVQSGARICRSWVSSMTAEQCLRVLDAVNTYNAQLCAACDIPVKTSPPHHGLTLITG